MAIQQTGPEQLRTNVGKVHHLTGACNRGPTQPKSQPVPGTPTCRASRSPPPSAPPSTPHARCAPLRRLISASSPAHAPSPRSSPAAASRGRFRWCAAAMMRVVSAGSASAAGRGDVRRCVRVSRTKHVPSQPEGGMMHHAAGGSRPVGSCPAKLMADQPCMGCLAKCAAAPPRAVPKSKIKISEVCDCQARWFTFSD